MHSECVLSMLLTIDRLGFRHVQVHPVLQMTLDTLHTDHAVQGIAFRAVRRTCYHKGSGAVGRPYVHAFAQTLVRSRLNIRATKHGHGRRGAPR